MNINLSTGKTISISYYQWLFLLKDEDVEDFLQSCTADDLGVSIENPFSNKNADSLDIEEDTE